MNRTPRTASLASLASVAAAAAAILSLPASADVIAKSRFETTGLFGMAALKSETETRQTADRRDDRTRTFFTGAMLKLVSGKKGLEGRTITRLDKEVVWSLNPKEKEYTELTFEEQRALLDRGLLNMKGQGPENSQGSPYKANGKPTIEVEKTGRKWKVGGYEGEQILATLRMPYHDSLENRNDTLMLKYDGYFARDAILAKELGAFDRAYAAKMRLDVERFRGLEGLFRYLEAPMSELGRAIGDQGVPIRFTLTVMKPVPPGDKQAAPEEGEGSGLKVPTSVGDATGQAIDQAFGFFKKKKAKEKQEARKAQDEKLGVPAGWMVINSNAFEYADIRIAPTRGEDFELPKGYKKVDHAVAQSE